MNETNISPRQSIELNLIGASEGISQNKLRELVKKQYTISKPTLLRDLNELVDLKLIRIEGGGRNTKYFPFSQNPALIPFDIKQYFLTEPDDRTTAKRSFDFNIFQNLNNLFSKVEIDELKKVSKSFENQTARLNPDILKRELERFVIELSWKSSKIEGNTYSLLETETLIKEHREAKGKSKDEAQMILNHKTAFEQILKNKNDFEKLNFSLINQLHNVIVKGLNISTGIRKQAVGVTGTIYKPLDNEHQLHEAMEKLVDEINNNNIPLQKALVANSMISYIQPFSDGNKRTGRMLTNAILLAYDYYPLSYRSVDEDEFKKALIIFYEQGSLYHLKRIFKEQLTFAYQNYFN